MTESAGLSRQRELRAAQAASTVFELFTWQIARLTSIDWIFGDRFFCAKAPAQSLRLSQPGNPRRSTRVLTNSDGHPWKGFGSSWNKAMKQAASRSADCISMISGALRQPIYSGPVSPSARSLRRWRGRRTRLSDWIRQAAGRDYERPDPSIGSSPTHVDIKRPNRNCSNRISYCAV